MIIEGVNRGVFFPQNKEYVCTSEMVRIIAEAHGKKIKMTKLFNPIIKNIKIDLIQKVFGDLIYDFEIESSLNTGNIVGLKESIEKTEMY